MAEETRDTVNLIQISTINKQREERHPREILETIPSTIDIEPFDIREKILDIYDHIYSHRTHRKCLTISYYTLLSWTLAVFIWICYWVADNYCENTVDPRSDSFICETDIVLEISTFALLGISPILFIFMIYAWTSYACYNPIDPLRENSILLKIEGDQWKEQLNYYYNHKKLKCLNCFRRKQRRELIERDYGYIVLSPHGIILDELILLSARRNFIEKGILSDDNKLLRLTFKRKLTRPWKTHISLYLPEHPIDQRDIEEIYKFCKIQTNTNAVFSS